MCVFYLLAKCKGNIPPADVKTRIVRNRLENFRFSDFGFVLCEQILDAGTQ